MVDATAWCSVGAEEWNGGSPGISEYIARAVLIDHCHANSCYGSLRDLEGKDLEGGFFKLV